MTNRAADAFLDVVDVSELAPGIYEVVTVSDAYTVDPELGACRCRDFEYNLDDGERCKHLYAAEDAHGELGIGHHADASDARLVADGGGWVVRDVENGNENVCESRAEAEEKQAEMDTLGVETEIIPPTESDGGQETAAEVVETADDAAEVIDHEPAPEPNTPEENPLPDRSVGEDPLNWVPGEFVDEIDGTQAINRKGFEVLSHFYGVDVHTELQVPPEETDHEYCRVKATAVTDGGRSCEAFGSAHIDRGDDKVLLLEMADTRARKRALSIATGVGAVAVEELKEGSADV
jgi:hypothetical protein